MKSRIQKTLKEIRTACAAIESAWERTSNDYFAFPEIANACTEGLDLSVFSRAENMATLLSIEEVAALQEPASFSDLYYVLYDNKKFYVEVLNWWGSDINIHDHDFSGVQFQVLGSSLNVNYGFEKDCRIDGVDLGRLYIDKAEHWPEGSRSCVAPGTPHNVSHLSEPTVSILFRTHPEAKYGPQRNYFAPNVAATYPVHDVIWRKRTKMLRLMSSSPDVASFRQAFRQLMDTQTACENLFTLIKMVDILFDPKLVDVVHEFAERDEISGDCARAAAYYRANEIFAKRLKYNSCLTFDETICMSALSSSFDRESFDKIHTDLREDESEIDLWSTLSQMQSRLEGSERDELASLIGLFDLERDIRMPALVDSDLSMTRAV